MNELVSVVIPTFNSEKTLSQCLESVKKQSYKNIEIIVVDKFSKDRTVEIASKYTKKVYQIKASERSEQKNFGARKARGEYLYFIDSDFILDKNIVEEAIEKCEKFDFDAICVHNTSDPNISFWSKVRKLERDCYKYDTINVAARFMKRKVFFDVNGFNVNLVAAEDYDLHNKILRKGYKIGFIDSEEIHIGEPKSLWEIAKKHYYYGKTISNFIKNNPDRANKQLNPLRTSFLKNWKFFLKNPFLFLGFIIYQFVRYFSAGLGFLLR